jgi:hypothetical protein
MDNHYGDLQSAPQTFLVTSNLTKFKKELLEFTNDFLNKEEFLFQEHLNIWDVCIQR